MLLIFRHIFGLFYCLFLKFYIPPLCWRITEALKTFVLDILAYPVEWAGPGDIVTSIPMGAGRGAIKPRIVSDPADVHEANDPSLVAYIAPASDVRPLRQAGHLEHHLLVPGLYGGNLLHVFLPLDFLWYGYDDVHYDYQFL